MNSARLLHGVVLNLFDLEVPVDSVAGDGEEHGHGQSGPDGDGRRLAPEALGSVTLEGRPEAGAFVHEGLQPELPQEQGAPEFRRSVFVGRKQVHHTF